MKSITKLSMALVGVLMLSGLFVASAAQAVRGPYFKVNGSANFMEESAKNILSPEVAKEQFVLEVKASGQVITCKSIKVLGVIWNLLPLRGDYLGKIHFINCTVAGNGAACEVSHGHTILTNNVLGLLAYRNANRTGPVLIVFHPDTGKIFATPEFEGECTVASTNVEGGTIGEVFSGGSAVEVGKNEVESTSGELHFTKSTKTAFVETGGGLVTSKGELKAFGLAATFSGQTALDLESGEKWGIFTT